MLLRADGSVDRLEATATVIGMFEKLLAPVCTKIGFNTNLKLMPLLERVALSPDRMHRVNLMNGWRLVRCINP